MLIGTAYTVLLIANAIIYTAMFIVCVVALYRNHLQKRTRVLMWCSAFYTLVVAHNQWARAIGRVQQHVDGIVANQSNAEYALFAMFLTTLGTIVLLFGIEYSALSGIVRSKYRRRGDDPHKESDK